MRWLLPRGALPAAPHRIPFWGGVLGGLGQSAVQFLQREIAAALGIVPSCVSKWTKRKLETGSVAPAQVGGYKRRAMSGDCAARLRTRIASGPFTLRGLTAELAERGIKSNARAVWVFVHAEGLSFKKPCCLRSRRALTPVVERYVYWMICIIGGGLIGVRTDELLSRRIPRPWWQVATASVLMTPPVTPLVLVTQHLLVD